MARTRTRAVGGVSTSHTSETRYRQTRGYAASRQAYDKRRRQTKRCAQTLAFMVLLRGDICSRCGHKPEPGEERLAVDHIVPLEHGGRDHWTNMTALCRPCNASKKARPLLRWLLGT